MCVRVRERAAAAAAYLVEQVAAEQHKINLPLLGNLENLLKRDEGIVPTDRIVLQVPNVVVRREKDL